MRKTLKNCILVGASAAFLIGAGVWYASSAIDPARLTALLSTSVKEATGRELKISGPVSLRIFPAIGVRAKDVALSNASWVTSDQLLVVKRLELDVKLFPLFAGRVEVSRIVLDDVNLNLQTSSQGQVNWDLGSSVPNPVTPKSNESQANSSGSNSSSDNTFVATESIQISNVKISYQKAGSDPKRFMIPRLVLEGDGEKAKVLIDAQYDSSQLSIKGKVSTLRETIRDWNQKPVSLGLDLNLTIDNKSLQIQGNIDKQPSDLPHFDLQLNSKSFDLVPLVAGAAVSGSAKSGGPVKADSSQSPYFFSDERLPFESIPSANGKLVFNIAELGVPHRAPLKNVSANLVFKGERLNIEDLKFDLGKGQAHYQLLVTQLRSSSPYLSMKGMAKNFTLEQILASNDSKAKVSGGESQFALNLSGHGSSLHQILGNASGAVQLSVGPARLDTQILNGAGDLALIILNILNPMSKSSKETTLECAVVYLPVKNGMININDSAGAETDKLDVMLSGTINLQNEAINLKLDPHDKTGLTTGIDLGGLVQLEGTILNPKTGVNKAGVVNSAVTIGLGILTSGISIAAENAKSLTTKRQPCKTALHSWDAIYPGVR